MRVETSCRRDGQYRRIVRRDPVIGIGIIELEDAIRHIGAQLKATTRYELHAATHHECKRGAEREPRGVVLCAARHEAKSGAKLWHETVPASLSREIHRQRKIRGEYTPALCPEVARCGRLCRIDHVT